jgi:hypothetical protein
MTFGTHKITAINGDMTVRLVDGKVIFDDLNIGDTFTVDNTSYEMTSAGLYDQQTPKS